MTDWTTCRVVRDKDGDLWGSAITEGERWWANLGYFVSHTTDELDHHFGPITPVLDADGLPVVTTVGDLTALDALPVGSVVMEGSSGAPQFGPFGIPVMPGVFHRFPDGWHVVSGHGVGTPEFDLGPLTVLHTPCEVLDLGEGVEQPSELLAQVRDAIKRGWAKCPLCQGSIRQTVGLTCELCGRYHGKDGEWQ